MTEVLTGVLYVPVLIVGGLWTLVCKAWWALLLLYLYKVFKHHQK